MLRFAASVVGLIGVGTFCSVMNGGPSEGERLARLENERRLASIRARIDVEQLGLKGIVAQLEASSLALEARETTIRILRDDLNTIVRAHPRGIPPDLFVSFSRSRARHDALVRKHQEDSARYAELYAEYRMRVRANDHLIQEGCALAESLGMAWYVAPESDAGARQPAPAQG